MLELDAQDPGLGAWTVNVLHNDGLLSADQCSAELEGNCNRYFSFDTVRITGASASALVGPTILGSITFTCVKEGMTTLDLSFSVFATGELPPEEMWPFMTSGVAVCEGPSSSGNVDCSERIDPVDAALILQLSAGLISNLPCPMNGDTTGDIRVDPVDAAVILQYVSGIVMRIPPQPPGPLISISSTVVGLGFTRSVMLQAGAFKPPGLRSWSIDVSFNPSLLRLARCAYHHGRCNDEQGHGVARSQGSLPILGDKGAILGDARLATLSFECLYPGTTNLTLSVAWVADAAEPSQPIEYSVVNGSITCLDTFSGRQMLNLP